jgi:amidase
VPWLFKDYKGREAGEPYHAGVRTLREIGYRARSDSPFALRVRSGGLIPIGRTNTPELAAMGTTEPATYGPTHNPWALDCSPGGSSGGAAAAVAARIVPVAHANDISGSIRIPAAMCGVVGLKPTRGRVLTSAGDLPIGMFVEGVVTRSVRDTAGVVDLLTDRSPWWPAPGWEQPLVAELDRPLTRLRVGVWTEPFNGSTVDAANAAAADATGRLLESLGHAVESAAPSVYSDPELWDVAKTLMAVAAAADAGSWVDRIGRALGPDDLEPRTWGMVEAGNRVTPTELFRLTDRLQAFGRSAAAWFADYDLLVTPTVATPPFPIGSYLQAYESGRGSAFTRPVNATGQPAISLPLGWPDDGLPRGVQLVGGYGADGLLIRVAAALERAQPWNDRVPGWLA